MEEKVIDFASSIRLAGGNASLAHELLGMLLQQLPEDRQDISTAYQQQNYEQLHYFVHKLHSAVVYCGVPRLQHAVAAMDIALKRKKQEEYSDLLRNLDFEIHTLLNLDKEKILQDE